MSETAQLFLAGFFGLAVLALGWWCRSFGVASDRDQQPINFWLGFGIIVFGTAVCLAIAVWRVLTGA